MRKHRKAKQRQMNNPIMRLMWAIDAVYRVMAKQFTQGANQMSAVEQKLKPSDMKIGGKYNWKHQPERLVYKGKNFSGNGYWHQFAKVESSGVVWCEVLDSDLHMFEETRPTGAAYE